ncbi:MAG: hypothetical protein KME12_13430 [Trichocoleus desertorum ATA4-8-CV12]|jgi:hypothetical protein|nr:hypothetical protein [Trichocoleus desertorum ATA4-8-CV12]
MTIRFLQPLTTSGNLDVARKQIEKVVIALPGSDDVSMIKQPGWVAIPCESSDHFDHDDCVRLWQTVSEYGYQNMIGVALESMAGNEGFEGVLLPTTLEAIEEFDSLYSFYWCALYAGKPDWMILFTKLDYFVIAGSESFVRKLVGCEFDEAFNTFHDYLLDESYQPLKEHLTDVYQHLLHDYPRAAPGEVVILREH